MKKPGLMECVAQQAVAWAGSSWAFASALAIILLWLISGPIFGFSDTWQLIVNTGTTVVTFLMVFLLQRSQNKESLAIQLKLNEIVAALEGASNLLINAEDLTEDEERRLHQRYRDLVELIKSERKPAQAHSVEEAETPSPRFASTSFNADRSTGLTR